MVRRGMDMVTEVIQGVLAIILVLVLGTIALIDAWFDRPFGEPITIAMLASGAIGFYFGQRGSRQAQQAASDMAARLTNGNTIHLEDSEGVRREARTA